MKKLTQIFILLFLIWNITPMKAQKYYDQQWKKISENYKVKDTHQPTIILTESEKYSTTDNCIYENVIFDKRLAHSIAAILYRHDIQSVIIEGGAKTLQSFIDANLWDEARIFSGEIKFQNGTQAPKFNGIPIQRFDIKGNQLNIFRNYD